MSNPIIRNILRLIVLVFIQVFILDNMHLGGYINPMLYVMFVLMLPFETPGWLMLFSSFVMGFSVDIFTGMTGIHTFSTVFMGFVRPSVLRLVSSSRDYEPGIQPSVRDLGWDWFLPYSILLVFIHHTLYFFVEVLRFSEFFAILGRTILSSLVTLIFIFLAQVIIYRKKKR